MKILSIIISCILLLGCQTGSFSGNGPIKFSKNAVQLFDSYISRESPSGFAITEDGQYGFYYYCPWNYQGSCEHTADTKLVYYCEKASGKKCLVFARGRDIVWKNPGDWRSGRPDGLYAVNHNNGGKRKKPPAKTIPEGPERLFTGQFIGTKSYPPSAGNIAAAKVCKLGLSFPMTARLIDDTVILRVDLSGIGKGTQSISGTVKNSRFWFQTAFANDGPGYFVSGKIVDNTLLGEIESYSCSSKFTLSEMP